jgi:hypothetical protein
MATIGTAVLVRRVLIVGAAALTAGVVGPIAPPADADRTVSAQEICGAAGLVAKARYFPPPVVGYCTHAANLLPGNSIFGTNEFELKAGAPGLPAGAYRVNAWDPLSPWVIPG